MNDHESFGCVGWLMFAWLIFGISTLILFATT